jgi:hypothetical protein
MPVEIRELVIRTVVTASHEDDEESDAESSLQANDSLSESDVIIQECVRQVLRIIRKERER